MSDGRFPTAFEIGAALHVATVLPSKAVPPEIAKSSYALIPAGGLYRIDHFLEGEALLVRCGLLMKNEDKIARTEQLTEIVNLPWSEALQHLLLSIIERRPPVWLFAATEGDEIATDLIPDTDLTTIATLVADPVRREEFLLGLARRFDAADAGELGEAGEKFVVDQCRSALSVAGRSELAAQVRRVSVISDQLGYDIVTPTLHGGVCRIEVKATRSAGYTVRVFLTRNEAFVGLRDPAWVLVICRALNSGAFEVLGWCDARAFKCLLPRDPTRSGKWMSVRLTLETMTLCKTIAGLISREGVSIGGSDKEPTPAPQSA